MMLPFPVLGSGLLLSGAALGFLEAEVMGIVAMLLVIGLVTAPVIWLALRRDPLAGETLRTVRGPIVVDDTGSDTWVRVGQVTVWARWEWGRPAGRAALRGTSGKPAHPVRGPGGGRPDLSRQAARLTADHRLPGIVASTRTAARWWCCPPTQVLRHVVPGCLQEDPWLARVLDEASGDRLCADGPADGVRRADGPAARPAAPAAPG